MAPKPSQSPAIDYDTLAAKHGGVDAPVDYDTLAAKYGGVDDTPSIDSLTSNPKKQGTDQDPSHPSLGIRADRKSVV